MPPRKKAATTGDEAQQPTAPSEEEILTAAQALRAEYHGPGATIKDWDDLAPAKQQRWIDKATGKGE